MHITRFDRDDRGVSITVEGYVSFDALFDDDKVLARVNDIVVSRLAMMFLKHHGGDVLRFIRLNGIDTAINTALAESLVRREFAEQLAEIAKREAAAVAERLYEPLARRMAEVEEGIALLDTSVTPEAHEGEE